jgi:signal transduction histidine kinase
VLRDFGFVAALREVTERLNSSHFKITLQISEEADLLPNNLQLSMFRMVQELLNNCIKHAEMSKADISVMIKNGYTTIKVADNGKGFNPDFDNEIKGSGLRGIKNRVFLLNGDFNLNTTKKGTIITIKFKNEF